MTLYVSLGTLTCDLATCLGPVDFIVDQAAVLLERCFSTTSQHKEEFLVECHHISIIDL